MRPDDQALAKRIGARLAELREQRGLSQAEVAERAGFTAKYISEIEGGKRDLPLSTLRAVAELGLRIDVADVFTSTTRPKPLQGAATAEAAALAKLLDRLPAPVRRNVTKLVESILDVSK